MSAGSGATTGGLRLVRPRPTARTSLGALLVVTFVVAGVSLVGDGPFVHQQGVAMARRIGASLLTPDLSLEFLSIVARASLLTVSYAIAGMTVALVVGLPGAVLVSGALVRRRPVRTATSGAWRGVFGLLRSMHELVWALLLLTILGPSPIAGVLAIGVPYGATLARVLGEHLQQVPDEPLAALRSAGASPWQVLVHGRVPLAAPDLLAYIAYRFECAVRAAAVLSFIGLGGIGYRLTLALADLRFDRVWPLLAALVALIAAIDALSARVRRAVLS